MRLSPTGGSPRLIWNLTWQAQADLAYAAYLAGNTADAGYWMIDFIKRHADSGMGLDDPSDLYSTIFYQITGDVTYAAKSWQKLEKWAIPPPTGYSHTASLPEASADGIHTFGPIAVIQYDWLRPYIATLGDSGNGLTAQVNFYNWLNWMAGQNLQVYPNSLGSDYASFGLDLGNINGFMSGYTQVAFTDLATGPENPKAGSWLKQSVTWAQLPAPHICPVGGLDPSSDFSMTDYTKYFGTVRNRAEFCFNQALSGAWPEGNQYVSASLQAINLFVAGCLTATGVDHMATMTRALPAIAQWILTKFWPGETDEDNYGDWQYGEGNSFGQDGANQVTNVMMMAGLLARSGSVYANYLLFLFNQWRAGLRTFNVKARAFLLFPFVVYSTPENWHGKIPKTVQAPLEGVVLVRDEPTTFLYQNVTTPFTLCNHTDPDQVLADNCLYVNAEQVLDGIKSYAGPQGSIGTDGNGRSCTLGVYGFWTMFDHHQQDAVEMGTDFTMVRSSTYGIFYPQGATMPDGYHQPYTNAPPEFCHEMTATDLFITPDCIICARRVNAEDPTSLTTLPHYHNYRDNASHPDWTRLTQASQGKNLVSTPPNPYSPQWFNVHIPDANPTFGQNTAAWTTPKGQQMQLTVLQPFSYETLVVDENATFNANAGSSPYAYPNAGYLAGIGGLAYSLRIQQQPPCLQWVMWLNVLTVGPGKSAQLITSSDGRVCAAQVHRGPTEHEVLACFSQVSSVVDSTQQPTINDRSRRILSTGFVLTWKAGQVCTEVYLHDLDPSKVWTWQVDKAPAKALAVTQSGFARVSVTGAYAHTLTLTAQ